MTYMTSRIRKSYPRFDRHGGYLEACAELARETGADAGAIYDEWNDRAIARLHAGEIEVEDAERLALEDVRDWYRRAS